MAFLESLDTGEVILNLEGDRFEEKKLRMCNNGIEICGNKNFCTFPEYNEFVRLNLNFCRFCRHSPFIAINNEPENFKLNVNDRQNIEKLFLHHNDKLLIVNKNNKIENSLIFKIKTGNRKIGQICFLAKKEYSCNFENSLKHHPALKPLFSATEKHRDLIEENNSFNVPENTLTYKIAESLNKNKKEFFFQSSIQNTKAKNEITSIKEQIRKDFVEKNNFSVFWEKIKNLIQIVYEKQELECDLFISSSNWNLNRLSNHLFPSKIQRFRPLTEDIVSNTKNGQNLITKILNFAKKNGVALGWNSDYCQNGFTGLNQLKTLQNLEATSRLFIDAVILNISTFCGVSVELEETLRSREFPVARFDYLIIRETEHLKGRKPPLIQHATHFLGLVEAKRFGRNFSDAFSQTVMQLLLLHSVKCKRLDLNKKSNIDKILPLFGIISDGLKYVFVVLGKAKVWISDVFVASREEDLLEIIFVVVNLVKGNFAGEIMADI